MAEDVRPLETLENLLGRHSELAIALVALEGVGVDDDGETAQQLETIRQILTRRIDAVYEQIRALA